MKKGSKKEYQ